MKTMLDFKILSQTLATSSLPNTMSQAYKLKSAVKESTS